MIEVKKIYIKGKRYIKFVIGFLLIYSAFLNNLSLVFLWLTLLFSTICHWFSYDLLFSNNNSDWHKVIALIYISPSHVLYIIFYYFFFFLSGKWSYRNGTNKRRNRIATLCERFSKCSQYAHATWKRGKSWKMKIVVILKTIPKEIIITYEVIKII